MSKPRICVTGATGKTGGALVRELLGTGTEVRAVVRRQDTRSEELARLGAEIMVVDMFDPAQMAVALRGAQRAYYCPPISPHTAMTLTAFLSAAAQSRLESVVAMTQWLASPAHPAQMTRDMWTVEQLMPTLKGTAVTILNPGFFADNYLRVALPMAAQLGLYPNFVGESENAPPSNKDIARVAAAVLTNPQAHDGKRYRITGPELIGVGQIVAALGRVLGRRVRAINAPEWLLNKVGAYRGEPRIDMAVLRYYLEDHRQGAFAFGDATDVVLRVTGKPAESFETTVRHYAALPSAQRNFGNFCHALTEFMAAPMWRGYDNARLERQLEIPAIANPLYAMENDRWKADRRAQLSDVRVAKFAGALAG